MLDHLNEFEPKPARNYTQVIKESIWLICSLSLAGINYQQGNYLMACLMSVMAGVKAQELWREIDYLFDAD